MSHYNKGLSRPIASIFLTLGAVALCLSVGSANAQTLFSADFSTPELWSEHNPATPPAQRLEMQNGEIVVQRSGASGRGGGAFFTLETQAIPVGPDTILEVEATPLSRSVANGCGNNCIEHPVVVMIHGRDANGAALRQIFGINYGIGDGVSKGQRGVYVSVQQGVTETVRFRLGDTPLQLTSVEKIMIGGMGWNFEGRISALGLFGGPEADVPTSEPQPTANCCDLVALPFAPAQVSQTVLQDGNIWKHPVAFSKLAAPPQNANDRAILYKTAILSAIALPQARSLGELRNASPTDNEAVAERFVQLGLEGVGTTADVAEILRFLSLRSAAQAHGASVEGIATKVTARFEETRLGQMGKWAGPLSTALTIASNFEDERDKVVIIQAAIRDAQILQALDLLADIMAQENVDPAMSRGLRLAQDEIAMHSQSALRSLTVLSVRALSQAEGEIEGLGVAAIASLGPALILREVVELGTALDEFEQRALVIAAQHNIVDALSMPLYANTRQRLPVAGFDAGFEPYAEASMVLSGMTMEASSSVYNALWEERWHIGLSASQLGMAIGLSGASVSAGGRDLRFQYRLFVSERAGAYWRAQQAALAPTDAENLQDLSKLPEKILDCTAEDRSSLDVEYSPERDEIIVVFYVGASGSAAYSTRAFDIRVQDEARGHTLVGTFDSEFGSAEIGLSYGQGSVNFPYYVGYIWNDEFIACSYTRTDNLKVWANALIK